MLHARILLKADNGAEAAAWSDEAISAALEVHATPVARVRPRFVEQGLEAALRPKPTTHQYARKRDGVAEAQPACLSVRPQPCWPGTMEVALIS